MQVAIRRVDGKEAKRVGRKSKATRATYQGREFWLGSPEHHALIKRAIRVKLEQNPEVARAFVATHPRPIIHDTGQPEKSTTAFPATVFTRILTELRDELRATRGSAGTSVPRWNRDDLPDNQMGMKAVKQLPSNRFTRSTPNR